MLRCAALSNTRLAQVLFSRWNLRPGSRQSGRHDIHLRRKVQHAASGLFIVAAHTLLGSRVQGTGFQLTPCMHVVFRGSPCPAAMGLVTQLLQSCSVLLPLASVCTRFADVTRRSTGGTCSSLVPFSDRTSGMPCQVHLVLLMLAGTSTHRTMCVLCVTSAQGRSGFCWAALL